MLEMLNGATARNIQELISAFLGDTFIETYRQHCLQTFPLATCFAASACSDPGPEKAVCNGMETVTDGCPVEEMEP